MKTFAIPEQGIRLGLRPKEPDDDRYVLATWLRSWSSAMHINQRERAAKTRRYKPDVDTFFTCLPTTVVCSVADPEKLHGWACGLGTFLAWAYVPIDLRGCGIGRAVIEDVLGGYPATIDCGNRKAKEGRMQWNESVYGAALEHCLREKR